MASPGSLSPCALTLYSQVEHLEIGVPEEGLTAEQAGYPWATVCAAIAAPRDDLFKILMLTAAPFQDAFDLTRIPAWIVPWIDNFAGTTDETPGTIEDDVERLRRRSGAKRGTPDAMRQAVQEVLDATYENGSVFVQERTDSAYSLNVATYASQTPPGDAVEIAARRAKVAGLVLTVSELTGQNYYMVREGAGGRTYSEVAAEFADYEAVRDTAPV